ncbi:MAG: hypothetical protein HY975_00250 [Candidatus Kerfeldbacteria bacterium]|nr:hypothetical protein [Candidatus Kerfeldbacteria bacterium]
MDTGERIASVRRVQRRLQKLACYVDASDEQLLEAHPTLEFGELLTSLKHDIPGLHHAPPLYLLKHWSEQIDGLIVRAQPRLALATACRRMARAPRHPPFFHLAATASLDLGSVKLAILLLQHAKWLHPGYAEAIRDLEMLLLLDNANGS